MIRATTMAAAFADAAIKDKKQKHWVTRTVIDRAMHTNVGNVREVDLAERIKISQQRKAEHRG